jgi:hypothetical protein
VPLARLPDDFVPARAGKNEVGGADERLPIRPRLPEFAPAPPVQDHFERGARPPANPREDDDENAPPPDKKLMELRLLLKSLTKKSDEEIDADLKRIGAAGRSEAGATATVEAPPDAATGGSAATAEVRVEVSASASVSVTASARGAGSPVQVSDPIALDIDGNGRIRETGETALFDLNADGRQDLVSNLAAPLLALDRNGNGRIDDGSELFGDQHGAANGFLELARLDANGDGRIDASDPDYMRLGLVNLGDPAAFTSLHENGIASIWLNYVETGERGPGAAAQVSTYEKSNGEKGLAADMLIGYRSIDLVR